MNDYTREYTAMTTGPYGSLFLKNYKAFGPSGQTLPLARLNLLFGANSAGKSSVFKAIKLVVDAFFGSPLADRAFSTTVHKGRIDESIVIGLCFRHPHESIESTPHLFFRFSERPEDQIGLDVVDVRLPNQIILQLTPGTDGLALTDATISKEAVRNLLPDMALDDVDDATLGRYLNTISEAMSRTPIELGAVYSTTRLLANIENVPQKITIAIDKAISEGLFHAQDNLSHLRNNLVHLPPIRRIPSRFALQELSLSETDFLEDVETRTWEILLKPRFERFLKEANFWMSEKGLSLGYEIVRKQTPSTGDEIPATPGTSQAAYLAVRDTTDPEMKAVDLDLTDVGVGVSQVIPVIGTACVHNELWIMIEQPELHLHPRLQCQLGDLFIAKSKDDLFLGNHNSGNVFFIETHSEHLVLRMLRRIRETSDGVRQSDHAYALEPEELAVFYFEPNREVGVQVHRMEITSDGDFVHAWPNGFFPERLRELR